MGPALTDLVGREEELELLLRRWSKAKTGEGQVVLLSGEPGIGKSRLTAALLEAIAPEPHTRLRNFCSPQHTDSALYPTIGQIERAAGFSRDDTLANEARQARRAAYPKLDVARDAALVAEMLSLPNDGRYPVLELAPQQRRQQTLEALVLQVATLSRQNPVLMIFEDVQWTDPTTLELFGLIVERIPTLHVLLIVTFRPEFEPPWIGRPYVTALTINRLGQREVSAMIDRVVGNKSLAESVREDIIERTDGIPLFVEEITKAVLEAESQRAAEHAIAVIPPPALEVPASLHASLMARLDRLGPAKEVAQIGAAIGREFSRALLAAVVRKPEEELNSALDRLLAAGLLFRQGVPPDTSYLFKHALVQDAAHGTLLREPRRALHARIAETLESQFADIAERHPELLARHCTEAGLIEKAARPVGQSRTAVARSFGSLRKPSPICNRGWALSSGSHLLPTATASNSRSGSRYTRRGFGGAAGRRRRCGRTRQPFFSWPNDRADPRVCWSGCGECGSTRSRKAGWQRLPTGLDACSAEGNQSGNIDLQILGHRASLSSHFYLGELNEALEQRDKVLALYDPRRAARWRELTGNDVRTAVGVFSSQALWMLGYPDQAAQMSDQKDADSRRLEHPFDIGWALTWGTYVFDYRREPDRLLARVHEADRIGREQSIPVLYQGARSGGRRPRQAAQGPAARGDLPAGAWHRRLAREWRPSQSSVPEIVRSPKRYRARAMLRPASACWTNAWTKSRGRDGTSGCGSPKSCGSRVGCSCAKAGAQRPRHNFERQSNVRAGSKPDHGSCAVRRRSLSC